VGHSRPPWPVAHRPRLGHLCPYLFEQLGGHGITDGLGDGEVAVGGDRFAPSQELLGQLHMMAARPRPQREPPVDGRHGILDPALVEVDQAQAVMGRRPRGPQLDRFLEAPGGLIQLSLGIVAQAQAHKRLGPTRGRVRGIQQRHDRLGVPARAVVNEPSGMVGIGQRRSYPDGLVQARHGLIGHALAQIRHAQTEAGPGQLLARREGLIEGADGLLVRADRVLRGAQAHGAPGVLGRRLPQRDQARYNVVTVRREAPGNLLQPRPNGDHDRVLGADNDGRVEAVDGLLSVGAKGNVPLDAVGLHARAVHLDLVHQVGAGDEPGDDQGSRLSQRGVVPLVIGLRIGQLDR